MKRRKPQNLLVDESFIIVTNPKFKNAKAEYKYCYKELNKNVSRLQIHLDNCKSYPNARQVFSTISSLQSSTRLV